MTVNEHPEVTRFRQLWLDLGRSEIEDEQAVSDMIAIMKELNDKIEAIMGGR